MDRGSGGGVDRGGSQDASLGFRLGLGVLLLALLGGLGLAVLSLPAQAPGLAPAVGARMAQSGVEHQVTAVLLNFRAYDTLLELAVLLLALLGVWSLAPAPCGDDSAPGPVLATLGRLLAPLMILMAGYLLWVGAQAPGGAFQAGAVLGAAGVLARLSGCRLPVRLAGWPLRLTLVLGVLVFAVIGVGVIPLGGSLLAYPPAWAGGLILVIETAATLSIAALLTALFLGGRP